MDKSRGWISYVIGDPADSLACKAESYPAVYSGTIGIKFHFKCIWDSPDQTAFACQSPRLSAPRTLQSPEPPGFDVLTFNSAGKALLFFDSSNSFPVLLSFIEDMPPFGLKRISMNGVVIVYYCPCFRRDDNIISPCPIGMWLKQQC